MPDIIEFMTSVGAIREGHFVYKSDLHGRRYLNKDVLTTRPSALNGFCRELARKSDPFKILVVPVVGAVVPGSYLALNQAHRVWTEVPLCYAEKEGQGFVLKRGFAEVVRGQNVTVFDDIFTTGGSAKGVISAVKASGGNVTQILGLVNRNPSVVSSETFGGIPLIVLANYQMESWSEEECPLCKEGVIPVDPTIGHGAEFLARQAA